VHIATSVLEDLVDQIGVKDAGHRSFVSSPDDNHPRAVIVGKFGYSPTGASVVAHDREQIPRSRNTGDTKSIDSRGYQSLGLVRRFDVDGLLFDDLCLEDMQEVDL
jgi:hypothetical protein